MNTPLTDRCISPVLSRPAAFFRVLAFACVGLLAAAIASPMAHAAGADGAYRLTKITASFKANGRAINIPANVLQSALVQNGQIVIKDGQAPIYGSKWSQVFQQFNSLGFKGKVKVSGPKNFLLKKSGKNYVGSSDKPVSLSVNGTFNDQKISLAMKIDFSVKVSKDILTMTVPIDVTAMGLVDVKGTVVLKAKKI